MRKGDRVITINSIDVNGVIFTSFQLHLPKTEIYIITNEVGYIMSTSFGVQFTLTKENEGKTVAGIVSHVQSIDDMLDKPLEKITDGAARKGWAVGMCSKEALLHIA